MPPEEQRERAAVAAHYCCELGEAALMAGDFESARQQIAAARVHDPDSARATILAAKLASACGDAGKATDLYALALMKSRAIHDAFIGEANAALGTHATDLAQRLRERPPQDETGAGEPARFRCGQCGVTSVTWHWRCPGCRSYDSLQSVNNRAS
jgi:lipopolysaccharide biosynthesis regulator YciM